MVETIAKYKYARLSAQKVRLVADQIRGLPVSSALSILSFSTKKAAKFLKKVLESAIANAEHNAGANIDELKVNRIFIDQAGAYKRLHARAKGRANHILKKLCHITIAVMEK